VVVRVADRDSALTETEVVGVFRYWLTLLTTKPADARTARRWLEEAHCWLQELASWVPVSVWECYRDDYAEVAARVFEARLQHNG
jgi:endonuclease YncB( thermonuclease family)